MSIETVKSYVVECDGCKTDGFWDNGLRPFEDADEAVDWMKDEYGWVEHEGAHFCSDCTEWNEDETEIIPKEEYL